MHPRARSAKLARGASRCCGDVQLKLMQGVYAEIILQRRAAGDAGTDKDEDEPRWHVVKAVYARQDGHDPHRIPHNIVLEAKVLQRVAHHNASSKSASSAGADTRSSNCSSMTLFLTRPCTVYPSPSSDSRSPTSLRLLSSKMPGS